MRKQECGPWSGGILAVSALRKLSKTLPHHPRSQDEMGMGKTIQMISLLVSDQGRSNLVIA